MKDEKPIFLCIISKYQSGDGDTSPSLSRWIFSPKRAMLMDSFAGRSRPYTMYEYDAGDDYGRGHDDVICQLRLGKYRR